MTLQGINKFTSGFLLEGTPLPYLSLQKIQTVLTQRNSCAVREEESTFEFRLYTKTKRESLSLLTELETTFDYTSLSFGSDKKRILRTWWVGKELTEVEPGTFLGTLEYEILFERDIEDFVLTTTTGTSFSSAIRKRYEENKNKLSDLNAFICSAFAPEKTKFPYVTIPSETYSLFQADTKSRWEGLEFSFALHHNNLEELEELKDDLDEVFSYATFNMSGRNVFSIEWQGDSIIEVSPSVWESTINYEVILEKLING